MVCVWVSVLQWRKVPLPFSVSFDGMFRSVLLFESRLWPDCTTGLFWYKPENRVSLGGTLRRRYAMVHIGKPRLSRRCAAPPVCYGAHRKTMSLRHAEPPVCLCKVQTVEETAEDAASVQASDGASFQAKRGASQLVCWSRFVSRSILRQTAHRPPSHRSALFTWP